MTIKIHPTHGDAVPHENTPISLHNDRFYQNDVIDRFKAERERADQQKREWTVLATELRAKRDKIQSEIESLQSEESDLKEAIEMLRNACNEAEDDTWYGYDVPFNDTKSAIPHEIRENRRR